MLLGAPVGTVAIVEGAHRAVVGLKAFMRDAIAERRRRPSDDMLSLLIHAEDQGQVLDEEELVATSAFILLAGYETTTHLISNGLLALLEHPDQLRRLRDQPELVRRDDQCQVPEIIVCLNSAAPTVGQNRSMGVVAPDSRHPGISPQLVASVVVSEALQGMM